MIKKKIKVEDELLLKLDIIIGLLEMGITEQVPSNERFLKGKEVEEKIKWYEKYSEHAKI